MKYLSKFLVFVLFFVSFSLGLLNLSLELNNWQKVSIPVIASAQGRESENILCIIFPFLNSAAFSDFCSGSQDDKSRVQKAASTTVGLISFALQLVFVGIIALVVYIIIKAAITYIRSEGETKQVEKAREAIKTVFTGIAALFVGLIGIVLVISFFGASGSLSVDRLPDNIGAIEVNNLLDATP